MNPSLWKVWVEAKVSQQQYMLLHILLMLLFLGVPLLTWSSSFAVLANSELLFST